MISKFLQYLQALVTADKAAIVAGLVGAVTLLATRFGLQLNASDTAYVAVLISALVTAFTHAHFALKRSAPPKVS